MPCAGAGSLSDRAGCGASDDWIACFGWLLAFVEPVGDLFTGGDELDKELICVEQKKSKKHCTEECKDNATHAPFGRAQLPRHIAPPASIFLEIFLCLYGDVKAIHGDFPLAKYGTGSELRRFPRLYADLRGIYASGHRGAWAGRGAAELRSFAARGFMACSSGELFDCLQGQLVPTSSRSPTPIKDMSPIP